MWVGEGFRGQVRHKSPVISGQTQEGMWPQLEVAISTGTGSFHYCYRSSSIDPLLPQWHRIPANTWGTYNSCSLRRSRSTQSHGWNSQGCTLSRLELLGVVLWGVWTLLEEVADLDYHAFGGAALYLQWNRPEGKLGLGFGYSYWSASLDSAFFASFWSFPTWQPGKTWQTWQTWQGDG